MITKKDLLKISFIFLLSRIIILFFIINNHNLNIYDSICYLTIAKNGYNSDALYAYFPLYPLLINILHLIIPSYLVSGILISNICSYISAIIIYKLIKIDKYKLIGTTVFLISPILGFNSICYTESLFILLTLLSFYYYKNNKFVSGVFVGLSMLTRNSGIILLGALGLDLLIKLFKKETNIKEMIIFVLPAVLIGSLFPIYLYIETSNPIKYITVQQSEWSKASSNFITVLLRDISFLKIHHDFYMIYVFILNWFFFFIALFYSIKYMKKEFIISVYTIVSLIAFTITCRSSSWDTIASFSLFRYILGLFPLYLYPFIKEKNKVYYVPFILYIMISITNTILIYSGLFIA